MAKQNSSAIMRAEQDGVEFFTVQATGESGMSLSGLARLCGVKHNTLISLISNAVVGQTRSKWLESLTGKATELSTNNSYKNATIIKADVCATVIKHYAFSGNEIAQTLDKFTEIGINTWIQGITEWRSQ